MKRKIEKESKKRKNNNICERENEHGGRGGGKVLRKPNNPSNLGNFDFATK